jgi:hypothetical protein
LGIGFRTHYPITDQSSQRNILWPCICRLNNRFLKKEARKILAFRKKLYFSKVLPLRPKLEFAILTMKLTLDDLKNKNLPGVQGTLSLSFEYLLASIGKEYSILNGYQTIAEFNSKNRLNFSKTLLYPFFVSLSNGHSESLYGLFGDFYALSFGPVSMSVFNLITKRENNQPPLEFFKLNSDLKPVGIQVNIQLLEIDPNKNVGDSFDIIKNKIKNSDITIADIHYTYEQILIDSDPDKEGISHEKPLYLAIESGIKAIRDQSGGNFFNAEADIMKLHASYFDAFKRRLTRNDASIISYSELEEGKRRPFYQNEISSKD